MMPMYWSDALAWIASAGLVAGQVQPAPEPYSGPTAEASAAGPVMLQEAPYAAAFAEAESLYVEGRLLEAIAAYHRLFIRTGEPVCLANLGRLHQERGNVEQAAEYYRRFLLHPRAADAQKQQVQRRLSEIAPEVLVVLRSSGSPAVPALVPEGPEPPPALPQKVTRSGRAMWIGGGLSFGIAVPLLVAGGVVAGQAQQLRLRLQTAEFESAAQRDATRKVTMHKQGVAIGLLISGAAALIVGSVLFGLVGRRADGARRIALRSSGLVVRF